jgi:hypothetical protein
MKHVFPSDLIVEHEIATALRRALAYLEEHGWCQRTAMDDCGRVCVGYAIQIVAGGLYSPTAELLRQVIGSRDIEAWNDSQLTTFAKVRQAFHKAIEDVQ